MTAGQPTSGTEAQYPSRPPGARRHLTRSRKLICLVVAVLAVASSTLLFTAASAHQEPAGCLANAANVTIVTDRPSVRNGETLTYSLFVSNVNPPGQIACLVTNATISFTLPDANGQPNGVTVPVTTLARIESNQSATFIGSIPYVVAVNPGVTTITARSTIAGTVHFSAADNNFTIFRDVTTPINPPPAVQIIKAVTPADRPEPGGPFTYTVTVTNPSTLEALTITSLTDSVYGDLRGRGTCNTSVGTSLAVFPGPGNTYTCTFTEPFFGQAGATLPDIATVIGQDDDGEIVTASDDAVVAITPAPPAVEVVKTVTPLSRIEPGGTFDYTVTVTNTSTFEPLQVISLVDDQYGNLFDPANALVTNNTCFTRLNSILPVSPGPGNSFTCTFTAPFTGQAGANKTNIVTVVGQDNELERATDSDDAVVNISGVPPQVQISKTAEPVSRPEPGGNFTYTVRVTNPSTVEPLTVTTLTDSVYGNLFDPANLLVTNNTCAPLVNTVLPVSPNPANFFECRFTAPFTGLPRSLTDVATVTGMDNENEQVSATDDAVVTITPIPPAVSVTKTANPLSLPEPGGNFTYTVRVTNTSMVEPLRVGILTDDIYGNLFDPANTAVTNNTCAVLLNTVLPVSPDPANFLQCSFTAPFTGVAGAARTDVVTVVGADDDGQTVTDTDDATVTIGGAPSIRVDKSVDPSTRPEPGGAFNFTVVLTNTGPETLTIRQLTDDVHGNLLDPTNPEVTVSNCPALLNTTLAPAASTTCTFTAQFIGVGGAQQRDVVTVVATNPAGREVTDDDDALITLTNLNPTIAVVKTASPPTMNAPGGNFTFTVVVRNTSSEPVIITDLDDDIYGDITVPAPPLVTSTTCNTLIGVTLAAGASSAPCSFTGRFTGVAGQSQTDIVTARATDLAGNPAPPATDDATVTLLNTVPDIAVEKSADPTTRPAPGGTFTFNVLVTNTGPNPLTITSLTDDVYVTPPISARGTCTTAIGRVLPSGGTYACSFPGDFTGIGGARQTDIVTVTGVDAAGIVVTDNDDATVTLTNVLPTVRVDKTADPLTRPAPSGAFTFTVVVTNTSAERVRIDRLVDAPFGDLATRAGSTCGTLIGTFLAPGASSPPCTFTATISGNAGTAHTDVVTVTVTDDEGTQATDTDDATVTLTGGGVLGVAFGTVASPSVAVNNPIFDTATLSGVNNPTGTITFRLYGPDNATCAGTPIFTSSRPVTGNGSYQSASFSPTLPGLYRWVAGYSGDANHSAAVTDCGDPLEQVQVTPLPLLRVDKTAAPLSLPAPGGTFTFNVVVTNSSTVALTIQTLTDDVYGDITRRPGSTCNTAIGTVLAPAGTYTCRFQGDFRGSGNSSQTDVVTVTARDSQGNLVRANDDAIVTITPPPGVPSITSTKVAVPSALPEPGGSFTFNYTVVNNGPDPVRITSLVDNVYGDLNGRGTCTVGARLVVGASYTCSFSGNFFGNAGAAQTDIITTTAVDDRGQVVTSLATATVGIFDVPPTITVVKTPDPVSRPAPGGSFRFTVTVTNTSFEPVVITSLVDDIYGDLNGRGSCSVGVRLAAGGGAYSCAFDGEFRGVAGASQTDVVTVVVVDDDNTSVTATARATVTLTPAGTPPVSPPPPPPPPPVTPPVTPPLVRTGSDLAGPARLAGLLLLVGMMLVAATRRFGEGGPGLIPVPAGPGSGPRPGGGGGLGFGGASWFSGSGPRRPQGPFAGPRAGLAEPPAPVREPAPEAPPVTDRELDWDGWMSSSDLGFDAPTVVDEPPVTPEVAVAELEPQPEAAVPEVLTAEVVVPDAVLPREVVVPRFTSALEGAALDAAQALSGPARLQAPPSGRRRGGKPGRR